jgi:hypothetical protein
MGRLWSRTALGERGRALTFGSPPRGACLDPCARQVEVKSSHTGMSVNLAVYRVLAEILEEEPAWSG